MGLTAMVIFTAICFGAMLFMILFLVGMHREIESSRGVSCEVVKIEAEHRKGQESVERGHTRQVLKRVGEIEHHFKYRSS